MPCLDFLVSFILANRLKQTHFLKVTPLQSCLPLPSSAAVSCKLGEAGRNGGSALVPGAVGRNVPRCALHAAPLNTVCMQPPPLLLLCAAITNMHLAGSEIYLGWEDSCLSRNLLPKMFPFPRRGEF